MNKERIAQNLAVVGNHFHSEALSEVEAAMETFTDDVVWEAPAPNGLNRSYQGKAAAGDNYRRLWASMRNVKFEPLQRFATEERVVDDSTVSFAVMPYRSPRAKCGQRRLKAAKSVLARVVFNR